MSKMTKQQINEALEVLFVLLVMVSSVLIPAIMIMAILNNLR